MCLGPCPGSLSLGLPLPSDTAPVGSGPTFPATQGHHTHNTFLCAVFPPLLMSAITDVALTSYGMYSGADAPNPLHSPFPRAPLSLLSSPGQLSP